MPQRPLYAVIDVGSHSIKLSVARRDPLSDWQIELEDVVVTGLGTGNPRENSLDPAACERTVAVLQVFAAKINALGVADYRAVGTMVLRRARDAERFVARVREQTGLQLGIISGEDEARLTYLGAYLGLPEPPHGLVMAVDIGGASTEIAWGTGRVPDACVSLPFGTISVTGDHGLADAVSTATVAAVTDAVGRSLAEVSAVPAPQHILAVGATPASLAALRLGAPIADSRQSHGLVLTPSEVATLITRLRTLPAIDRRRLPGLHPDRAAVILAGAVIVDAVMRRWPGVPVVVSSCDLRLGLLADSFAPER
jgi:exopolyphosphatase/guanosine-5'-triphosphate,3'-diphosphate pyrophosphatase